MSASEEIRSLLQEIAAGRTTPEQGTMILVKFIVELLRASEAMRGSEDGSSQEES